MARDATDRRAATSGPDRRPVASALVAYGIELAEQGAAQVGSGFTGRAGPDSLIASSPEAFLLGVLFTQGIPAERAWAGPYLLRERLGHLDLERLASEHRAVARAVAAPPALHRFVRTVPGWIVSAARRLLERYGGSAARIWPDGAHVLEVSERLLEFDGIGEKKAAMTVEILRRHFGVRLTGIECGTVAYDVHVRRVFMRTGLIDADTPMAVQSAARAACPEAPGVLDLATWLIGRESCRPTRPQCETCRIGGLCPRLIDRSVTGVGVRSR
jgi:uncharacterized HhH-GPD family protein